MSSRKERRAEVFKARKAERKAGFVYNPPSSVERPPTDEPKQPLQPPTETTETTPSDTPISDARLAANRANAIKSRGPLSDASKAVSAQNHTIRGLARHRNDEFKILENEDATVLESFKQSIFDEHQPTTPTEFILVDRMIESDWLAQRARRLQVKRKAELGVEAQRAKKAAESRGNERHEMKKINHVVEMFPKDLTAQHCLDGDWWEVKTQAA